MKITIRNRIKIDQEEELIKEVYTGQFNQTSSKKMLVYKNEAKEKVMLKFDDTEMCMTRFSTSPILMRFHPDFPTQTTIEGLGKLTLLTEKIAIDPQKRNIKVAYQLLQQEMKVGDYSLRIDWEEKLHEKEER